MKGYKKITINSYNKTYKDYTKLVGKLHPYQQATIFLKFLKKNSSILDLGCGSGRDTKVFSRKRFHVTGIDLSSNMIKSARKNEKNAEFKVMDMLSLKFRSNSFDAVWANGSLLHISKKHLPKALREVRKVIKKDGIFYLSLKKGTGEMMQPDERYNSVVKFWSFYSKKEIETYLKKSGFKVIKSSINKRNSSYSTHPWISVFCRKN